MDLCNLICAVENHRCLYDKRDKHYKNLLVKESEWGAVSDVTGIEKDECKRRWNLLRERFSKELKKLDIPSGSKAPVCDEWPYLQNLMFLKEFIKPRKTKSNSVEIPVLEETEDSILEMTPTKRGKYDFFAESCATFNDMMQTIQEKRDKRKDSNEDVDEQFFKTIVMLYKDLPEAVKDSARIEILTYITSLRTQHLSVVYV